MERLGVESVLTVKLNQQLWRQYEGLLLYGEGSLPLNQNSRRLSPLRGPLRWELGRPVEIDTIELRKSIGWRYTSGSSVWRCIPES